MKNGVKAKIQYFLILLLILTLLSGVFSLAGTLCGNYCDAIDAVYLEKSREDGADIIVPSASGNGMGLDYVYRIKDPGGKKMIIFGASTSIAGMEYGGDYALLKACSGSATVLSYRLMKNYIEALGIHAGEDDIIKIDISAVVFKKGGIGSDVLASALEYGGLYKAEEDGSLKKSALFPVRKLFALSARSMQRFFEYRAASVDGDCSSMYKTTVNNYKSYDKLISIDEEKISELESFILSFDTGRVVVDILYESGDFAESKAGSEFNLFVDGTLIPFLEENGIDIIDSRSAADEESFMDNTHLNYGGRIKYTEFVLEQLKGIVGK